ncbi:MAG: hypothetical protein ACHQT5_02135, partial [Candidatus Saccharimonadales bacterium]
MSPETPDMGQIDQVRRALLIAGGIAALGLAASCSSSPNSSSATPYHSASPTISAQPSPEMTSITNDPQLQLLEHY